MSVATGIHPKIFQKVMHLVGLRNRLNKLVYLIWRILFIFRRAQVCCNSSFFRLCQLVIIIMTEWQYVLCFLNRNTYLHQVEKYYIKSYKNSVIICTFEQKGKGCYGLFILAYHYRQLIRKIQTINQKVLQFLIINFFNIFVSYMIAASNFLIFHFLWSWSIKRIFTFTDLCVIRQGLNPHSR